MQCIHSTDEHLRGSKITMQTLRTAFRRGFAAVVGLYSTVALAGLIFLLVDRTENALIEYAKTGFVYYFIAAPVVLLACLLFRRWRLAVWTIPAFFAFAVFIVPPYLPKASISAADAHQITVMTFNINAEFGNQAIVEVIRAADPDIIAFTELGAGAASYLRRRIGDTYPHQALHGAGGHYNYFRGQGIFSKYPVLNTEYWRFEDLPESHGHQRAQFDINGTTVTIYNTHPWPPLEWGGGLDFYVVPENDAAHRETIRRLIERADGETGPVILLGDWNMTEQSNPYREVTSHYTDSFREVGVGFGNTYPAGGVAFLPELIRIDYIFHNEWFKALNARVLHIDTPSDHLPLVVELALVGPEESEN